MSCTLLGCSPPPFIFAQLAGIAYGLPLSFLPQGSSGVPESNEMLSGSAFLLCPFLTNALCSSLLSAASLAEKFTVRNFYNGNLRLIGRAWNSLRIYNICQYLTSLNQMFSKTRDLTSLEIITYQPHLQHSLFLL